jgi:hypothetical protein
MSMVGKNSTPVDIRSFKMNVSCPKCNVSAEVPETMTGKRVTCKKCGEIFVIDAPVFELTSSPLISQKNRTDIEIKTPKQIITAIISGLVIISVISLFIYMLTINTNNNVNNVVAKNEPSKELTSEDRLKYIKVSWKIYNEFTVNGKVKIRFTIKNFSDKNFKGMISFHSIDVDSSIIDSSYAEDVIPAKDYKYFDTYMKVNLSKPTFSYDSFDGKYE